MCDFRVQVASEGSGTSEDGDVPPLELRGRRGAAALLGQTPCCDSEPLGAAHQPRKKAELHCDVRQRRYEK